MAGVLEQVPDIDLKDIVLPPVCPLDNWGRTPEQPAPTHGVALSAATRSAWPSAVLADVATAFVVTANVAPVVAVLLTAIVHAYSSRLSLLPTPDDLLTAALINYLTAWVLVAIPCWLLRLAQPKHVNCSCYEKLREELVDLQAWSGVDRDRPPSACGDSSGPCCRVSAASALGQHVAEITAELERASIRWVLGSAYISLWRRLNAARALLPFLEPLDRVRTRAEWLSSRLDESSLPATLGTWLQEARGALRATDTRAGETTAEHSACEDVTGEREARAVVSQVQYAVDDFRTDRYAGLVQARNLLLGTSGVAGVVLYALLLLALAAQPQNPGIGLAIEWCVAFYLVGATVGLFNLLYVQAGIECSVEDYSLSTARAVVAPQLAGMAAILGVVITAMTGVAQGSSDTAIGHFTQAVNFLPAAGFALSPGVILAGLRKRTEEYKQDLKSSRATGPRRP